MQRELSDDAPWKRIQQNTFTRWANEHLKLLNRHVDDLQAELGDGLNLIALIEVLSQKKIPRYNKKPNFRSQKLENVSVVLDFLENTERIRLVNIGKCPSAGDQFHTRVRRRARAVPQSIGLHFRSRLGLRPWRVSTSLIAYINIGLFVIECIVTGRRRSVSYFIEETQ